MDESEFRHLLIQRMCSQKCMGHTGNHGGCCTLDQRDWILGPAQGVEKSLKRLSEHFGRAVPFEEVFVDFEEGKAMFPDRSNWQNPANYPAIRVEKNRRNACRFYDYERGGCGIHEARPELCRSYLCGWLKETIDRVC